MKELQYQSYSTPLPSRVSWSAIIAGASISFMVMACLGLLGTGVGFISAPAADSTQNLALGIGVGGAIWLLISGFVAFYSGGWVAGRLTSLGKVSDSVIHGLLSWSTATLAFLFMTSVVAGGTLGGVLNAMGTTVGTEHRRVANIGTEATRLGPGDRLQRMTARRVSPDEARQQAGTAAQTAGAVGLFGFILLAVEGIASMLGARAGTRVIRLTPAPSDQAARRTAEPSIR